MLFSDHVGDCLAPCYFACPAHMDIPLMLEHIGEQHIDEAISTIKQDIALPAVLGRVCSRPCEKGCRRTSSDGAVAVCELKRFVADADLARPTPFLPSRKANSGKSIAVVGAGPTGLSAAYYLQQEGHHCVLYEKEAHPGGRLRTESDVSVLPISVLDSEIEQVLRLGASLRTNCRVDDLNLLLSEFDSVLLSCGHTPKETLVAWGLDVTNRGVAVDKDRLLTSRPSVFAAGSIIRNNSLYVRSVADGKLAALAIGQFLAQRPIVLPTKTFSSRIGSLQEGETQRVAELAGHSPRALPPSGAEFSMAEAAEQSDRCFSCGCLGHGSCKLERYAIEYGADPTRYAGKRKPLEIIHRPGGVRFEPNKCIKCELCVQIAARAGEPLGLTLTGRGFDVQLAVPFDEPLEAGLTKAAEQCVAACPTGALTWARYRQTSDGQPG